MSNVVDEMIIRYADAGGDIIPAECAAEILAELRSEAPDDLAAWLNMSARTLHRQLKEEGASLQALKDGVRRDVAMAQLQRTSRPMKQIAEAAGFQNEKSFIRAFKGWTGSSPEAFRQQHAR